VSKPLRNIHTDVAEVAKRYPAGSRLLCPKNGKTYQIGTKNGQSHYWMLCEQDSQRGLVEASLIMRDFEKAVQA